MATHSNMLAWKILWTEGLGELQSMGSQKAGHGSFKRKISGGGPCVFPCQKHYFSNTSKNNDR